MRFKPTEAICLEGEATGSSIRHSPSQPGKHTQKRLFIGALLSFRHSDKEEGGFFRPCVCPASQPWAWGWALRLPEHILGRPAGCLFLRIFPPHQQHHHYLGTGLKGNFLDLSSDLLMRKSKGGPDKLSHWTSW